MRKMGNILLICVFLALLIALPSCREGLQAGMDSYTVTLRVSESKAIENPSISHISFTVSDGDGLEISSGWKEAGSPGSRRIASAPDASIPDCPPSPLMLTKSI